jgi:hypothetical protein
MDISGIIYGVLSLLSALGVGGWIKKKFDLKKAWGEAGKWYKKAVAMKDLAAKAKKYAKDGYSHKEIEELMDELVAIFDED